MNVLHMAVLASAEETTEIVEEVLEHNIDDVYRVLSSISNKLSNISLTLDSLLEMGTDLLQLLQNSYLDSIVALLLILVGFECIRIVRGWLKGGRQNERT